MNLVLQALEKTWYRKSLWSFLLLPLSLVYGVLVHVRAVAYRFGTLKSYSVSVPLVVVGNISVGGSGKTPLVMELVRFLVNEGFSPGVVSRGYRGRTTEIPCVVHDDADPILVGDEPLLIHQETRCPVVVDRNRVRGAQYLVSQFGVNVVVSDDGLQHLRLSRTIEIVVIDGERRFGNGYLLPAGPLRESCTRKESVDFVVTNGYLPLPDEHKMRTTIENAVNLMTGEKLCLSKFVGKKVYAIAGIGHPNKFFSELRAIGLNVVERIFPDHHVYSHSDLADLRFSTVLMTSKDAVKCRKMGAADWWSVPQTIVIEESFKQPFLERLKQVESTDNDAAV